MPGLSKFQRDGKFLMFAFDHRGSFKKLMNANDPDSVTDEQAISLKKEIIDSVRDQFSAILIDQDIGLKAYEPKDGPFLLPVERSGYEKQGLERLTEVEYSIDSLIENGASGAKILVFVNPYGKTLEAQIATAKKVLEECKQKDFPYFLEIRNYNNQGLESDKMSSEEREKIAIESLKVFVENKLFPDVFKLEYPGSAVGCQTYTAILEQYNIPWILLTMADSYGHFCTQLEKATIRGCKGFLAGRSLWSEACSLQGKEKEKFLKETLPERFRKISEISLGNN